MANDIIEVFGRKVKIIKGSNDCSKCAFIEDCSSFYDDTFLCDSVDGNEKRYFELVEQP